MNYLDGPVPHIYERNTKLISLGLPYNVGMLTPCNLDLYYIHINDRMFELSVFWPSDSESWINELRFSDSVSLSFKTRLTSVTCFCGYVT